MHEHRSELGLDVATGFFFCSECASGVLGRLELVESAHPVLCWQMDFWYYRLVFELVEVIVNSQVLVFMLCGLGKLQARYGFIR